MVWRRFLLASETSLADLHEVLQFAFGWSSFYLYEFCIHGKTFGRNAEDPRSVCLGDFQLHVSAIGTTSWHSGNAICVWKQLFRFARI